MRKVFILIIIMISINLFAQELNNTHYAVPFLTNNPNSRIGGIGEIDVVSSHLYKDAGFYSNPSLLSNQGKHTGIYLSYLPWLRALVNDMSFIELNGYYSINSANSIGLNFTYCNLGEIYTASLGEFHSYELAPKIIYSHSFNHFSAGIAGKYIRSVYGNGYINDTTKLHPINSYAVDIGFNYKNSIIFYEDLKILYNIGLSIDNFGPKVSYSNSSEKMFIPTTLNFGILFNPETIISKKEKACLLIAYQAEKHLVPTPPIYNSTGEYIIKGKDPNINVFKALTQSFYDAPGGYNEELNEILHKIGGEASYNYNDFIYVALRTGLLFEHVTKGNRKYMTTGFGFGYKGFTIDFKYLITRYNNPMKHTWGITLGLFTNLEK